MLSQKMCSFYGRAKKLRNFCASTTTTTPTNNNGGNKSCATKTDSNVVRSPFPDVQVPNCTLDEYMWSKLERWPDKTALVCGLTGRSMTHHEVYKKSRALARALRWKLKLKRGDTVAAVLPNVPEYPVILLAAIHAGVVVTTVNPIYTVDEITKQLVDSDARFVFTLNESVKHVTEACRGVKDKQVSVVGIKSYEQEQTPKGAIKLDELIDNDLDPIDSAPQLQDTAILPYSSGTTGLPKGVELTYGNLLANLLQIQAPKIKLNSDTTDIYQDTVPNVLPLFHIYGLVITNLNMLNEGCKIVTLPRFKPDSFLNLLSTHKPTMLHCAPPMVLFLLNHPDAKEHHIESLKYLMTGAAPLGATDIQRFLDKSKGRTTVLQGYGLTETSPLTHVQSRYMKLTEGSIGPNVPSTLSKIISVDGDSATALGPNRTGELCVRGPQVMKGYLNNKEATDNCIKDGWFHTGDIGHYDEEGQFYITDRMKELIKVKGFQVAPAELEAILRHHPAIEDAAVIGVPHPKFGEVPKAFVVFKKDVKINFDDVHRYVNAEVAEYKRLIGGIVQMEQIPKSLSGKILRRELKKMESETKN